MRLALLCSVIVLVTSLGGYPATAKGEPLSPAALATAQDLEKRLLAPCCWRETLATHESPTANKLRREIRTRIAEGESASAIETDLVRRHGPGLRAALPDNLGYILFGLAGLGGIVILRFMLISAPSPPVSPLLGMLRLNRLDHRISPEEFRRLENLLDDDLEKELN